MKGSLFCQRVIFHGDATLIFFCSKDQLNLLLQNQPKQIFIDGFHKVPKDFKQLVSVFGYSESKNAAFAIFHCLLNSKLEEHYNLLFEEFKLILKSYFPTFIFEPEICTTDYEKGLINAVQSNFKNAKSSGCFFHFLQCQIRNFQSLHLLKKDQRKTTFQLLTLISSLCFIPPEKIKKVYEEIKASFLEMYSDYFKYFEENWISGYSLELWNYWKHYEQLKISFQKTNNILESFHSLLLHLNNHSHQPSLSLLLSSLSYIESRQVNDFNRLEDKIMVSVNFNKQIKKKI